MSNSNAPNFSDDEKLAIRQYHEHSAHDGYSRHDAILMSLHYSPSLVTPEERELLAKYGNICPTCFQKRPEKP